MEKRATAKAMTGAAAVLAVCAIFLVGETQAQQGTLTVTPSSGPVGTTVTIDGTGCNNPGDEAHIVFGGDPGDADITGRPGADGKDYAVDSQNHFSVTYTVPSQIGTIQGRGGGEVVPGVYKFFSKPPYCATTFTVTASGLPPGGSAPASAPSAGLPFWAIAGFGIVAVGAGAAIVRFGLRRRSSPRGP